MSNSGEPSLPSAANILILFSELSSFWPCGSPANVLDEALKWS